MSFEYEDQTPLINYKLIHSEIDNSLSEDIVQIASIAVKQNRLEKDAAFEIVKKLRESDTFEDLGFLIRSG